MRVYGYARISRDEDKTNYGSIITQKQMIEDYTKEQFKTNVIKIFEDDNVSGYTFNRPSLNELRNLIEMGEVDVLVVKDISRIGRHNAKTLLFLEFIEENDVQIEFTSGVYNDDIIGIETWYNEKYIKDTSKKIRDKIRDKQKREGMVIKTHFGYKKDEKDKHKLVIDEESAMIVKDIFKLYIDGNGYRKIADILNERGVITPSQYKQRVDGGKHPIATKWSAVHVNRIISNDIYTGDLRCGKTQAQKIKGKPVKIDKEDQIIHENYHPAIISREDFNLVQQIGKRRDQRKIRSGSGGMNLFSGYLYCGDCGSYMIGRKRTDRDLSYCCGKYHQFGRSECTSHTISEKTIIDFMLLELNNKVVESLNLLKEIDDDIEKKKKVIKNYDKIINKLSQSIDNKKEEVKNYARQMAKGLIDEEIYKELTQEANQELKILNEQLEDMKRYQKITMQSKDVVASSAKEITDILSNNDLKRRDVERLLEKIYVYHSEEFGRFNDKGQLPKLKIKVEWNTSVVTMCTHNQVIMITHGNDEDVEFTQIQEIIKQVEDISSKNIKGEVYELPKRTHKMQSVQQELQAQI